MKRLFRGRTAACIILILLGTAGQVALSRAHAAEEKALSALLIHTSTTVERFDVEIAADDATRETGLMFRKSLAPRSGMLFDFGQEQPVSMWMKNTYVPLDMLFIRADGRVSRIEEETTPQSTRIIESGEDVRFVLEVPGGTAHHMGLAAGDRVEGDGIGPVK